MRPELEALQAEIDARVAWDLNHPEEARERRLELLLRSRRQHEEVRELRIMIEARAAEVLARSDDATEPRPSLRVIEGGRDDA